MTSWILNDKSPVRPVNAQVDSSNTIPRTGDLSELVALTRRSVQLQDRTLAAQNRQNELLEELLEQFSAAGRQRAAELGLTPVK